MNYWLFKSEPSVFAIDDLIARPGQTACWDGVRNYQARNWLRDSVRLGDQVFFYHSNTAEPGIYGIAEVVREGYPDPSAFDPTSPYCDAKSDPARPRWYGVDLRFVRKLARPLTLSELKGYPELAELALLKRGNRLSVMPVAAVQWAFIVGLETLNQRDR